MSRYEYSHCCAYLCIRSRTSFLLSDNQQHTLTNDIVDAIIKVATRTEGTTV